jgi:hypothetical protein
MSLLLIVRMFLMRIAIAIFIKTDGIIFLTRNDTISRLNFCVVPIHTIH